MNYKHFPSLENDGADVSYAYTYPTSGKCTAAWQGKGSLRFYESSFEKNPTQYVLINMPAELPVREMRLAQLTVWQPLIALDRLPKRLR